MSVRFVRIPNTVGLFSGGYYAGQFNNDLGIYKTYFYRESTVFQNSVVLNSEVAQPYPLKTKYKCREYDVYRCKFSFGDYLTSNVDSFSSGDQVIVYLYYIESDVRTMKEGLIEAKDLYIFSNPERVLSHRVFKPRVGTNKKNSIGSYDLVFNGHCIIKPGFDIRVCVLYCMVSGKGFVYVYNTNKWSGECTVYYK